MSHMKVTRKSYLEHMIPHHQVAIDMSKRLLLHTNRTYLIDFCRKLIIDQQNEIFLMHSLLENGRKQERALRRRRAEIPGGDSGGDSGGEDGVFVDARGDSTDVIGREKERRRVESLKIGICYRNGSEPHRKMLWLALDFR